eukprot:6204939-Pleurochrysis_carterae.AAC.2
MTANGIAAVESTINWYSWFMIRSLLFSFAGGGIFQAEPRPGTHSPWRPRGDACSLMRNNVFHVWKIRTCEMCMEYANHQTTG